jgi:1-acyl-sn-glycerol-3-phosphate acyltransferase
MSLLQRAARATLRLFGWRLLDLPARPDKCVAIAYPHTSNWDFPIALLGLIALGIEPRWVAKDSLFRGLFGKLMFALGGIPVNRRERTGFVGRMAEEFARHPRFVLCIAPEGTRSLAEGWKSGFYRIALAAQVPVLPATIDYQRRELGMLEVLHLSGDEDADFARLAEIYADRIGHRPTMMSPIRLLK